MSTNAAIVTSDKPRQGKQTVRVLGADLVPQGFINDATDGYYDAIGSYRRAVNYDTGNAQTVRLSAHVRIDGPGTATGNNLYPWRARWSKVASISGAIWASGNISVHL